MKRVWGLSLQNCFDCHFDGLYYVYFFTIALKGVGVKPFIAPTPLLVVINYVLKTKYVQFDMRTVYVVNAQSENLWMGGHVNFDNYAVIDFLLHCRKL